MSKLQTLLGMPQPSTQQEATTPNSVQQPVYPVDWQNGQTTSGTAVQQNIPKPMYLQGVPQQTGEKNAQGIMGNNNLMNSPASVQNTTTNVALNNSPNNTQDNQHPTQQRSQPTGTQATQATAGYETPEEAYQRVMNEKGGEPSAARKKQAQSLSELTQYIEELGSTSKPDNERKAKENKHARQRALFAAIGDGLMALSNLYFTAKGAPNAYNPNASLSKANLDRWEKMKAQREKDADKYMNILKTKYGMDSQEVNAEIESDKVRDQKATNAAARAARANELRIKEDGQKTAKKKADDDAAYKQEQLKISKKKAEDDAAYKRDMVGVARQRAATAAAVGASTIEKNRAASAASGTKDGKKKTHYVYEKSKKGDYYIVHEVYGTNADADKYAQRLNGAWVDEQTTSKREGSDWGDTGTTTTKRSPGHRFIPSSINATFHDRYGNRIWWDRNKAAFVRRNPNSTSKGTSQKTSTPQKPATQQEKKSIEGL